MNASTPIQNATFQASWPTGHKPIFPSYTSKVAAVALVIFASYYSKGLAIGIGIALTTFWTVRKVVTFIVHPIVCLSSSYSFMMSPLAAPLAYFIPSLKAEVVKELSNRDRVLNKLKENHTQVRIKTPDGVSLEGMFWERSKENQATSTALIYLGNEQSEGFEQQLYARDILDTTDCIFCFNSRGIYESEGTFSFQMAPYDVYTAFEYLVSLGYKPENICICGSFVNGALAILGASLAEAAHPKAAVGILNINSFSSLPHLAQHFFNNQTVGKIASVIMRIFVGKLDTTEAWRKLRHSRKTTVLQGGETKLPTKASLYEAEPKRGWYFLQNEDSSNGIFFNLAGQKVLKPYHHDKSLTISEHLKRILG